jgi:hypothetical protein
MKKEVRLGGDSSTRLRLAQNDGVGAMTGSNDDFIAE